MTSLSGDANGTWTVWGDEAAPISECLGKNEAASLLETLRGQGREDVYAMDDATGAELVLDD